MEKETGKIHIYCGSGKGKTTAAMGLCARAAGHGKRVLICQFMKDNSSGERQVLGLSDRITLMEGLEEEKFSFRMSEEEKEQRRCFYSEQFRKAAEASAQYDVLLLDEILYAIGASLFDETALVSFLKAKPEALEVILTGQNPGEEVLKQADYISEIQSRRHPYTRGLPARAGIEY